MRKYFGIAVLISITFSSCLTGRKLKEGHTYSIVDQLQQSPNVVDEVSSRLGRYNLRSEERASAEYVIQITSASVEETSHEEQVTDESSPDFGKFFEIEGSDVRISGDIYKNEYYVASFTASASTDEKLTCSRSFGQWLFGQNKESNEYRVKGDPLQKALRQVGNEASRKISRKIYNDIN
jgi:hypothetical protein